MSDSIKNSKTKNDANIYSVTRLNREVRAVLEGSFRTLWVKGEISNMARPASGHWYFSLKDANSQVRCAMFRGRNRLIKFQPENGDEVLLQANVGLYEGRGEFQLIVEQMEPAGEGVLQKEFERLKQKLFAEGLFNGGHKKALPKHPKQIGVMTSPTGAAVHDILNVLKRRYPLADIIIYPVPVQGEGAAEKICSMLKTAQERNEVDILIIARGGGSIEDLWAFNDEKLARLLFATEIPVISGIGHEIDFTIADFVSDYRAPTPSAAAEMCSCNLQEQYNHVLNLLNSVLTQSKEIISNSRSKLLLYSKQIVNPQQYLQHKVQLLDNFESSLTHSLNLHLDLVSNKINMSLLTLLKNSPSNVVSNRKDNLELMCNRLDNSAAFKLSKYRSTLQLLASSLHNLSPINVIGRGYTLVTKYDKKVVRSTKELLVGDTIHTRFVDGIVESKITKKCGL